MSLFSHRLSILRSSVPLPLLLLPNSRSRHNLLDSLTLEFLGLHLKDLDCFVLVTREACLVAVPGKAEGDLLECHHSMSLMSCEEGEGSDLEKGYEFVGDCLREALVNLPYLHVFVPRGYEDDQEVKVRWRGLEGYEGEIRDAKVHGWNLYKSLDCFRVRDLQCQKLARAMVLVGDKFKRCKMNWESRRKIDIVVVNDVLEEFYEVGRIICADRNEIEQMCGEEDQG